MVIETKIKWSFTIILLITVLVSNFKDYKNVLFQSGTSNNSSFVKGKENVQLMFNVNDEVENNLLIESLTKDWELKKVELYPKVEFDNMLLEGMKQNVINISKTNFDNVKSGIYTVNQTIPLVIKEEINQSEITIVYPYMNNGIYESFNGENVFTEQLTATSLNRPQIIGELTSCMTSFFKTLDQKYDVSYISDLDLEIEKNFFNSKVLIIYGNFGFATSKMKLNILNYLKNGGKIILGSTKFLNNVCEYSTITNTVFLNKELFDNNISTDDNYIVSNYDITGEFIDSEIGLGYGLCDEVISNKGYEIRKEGHRIFEGLDSDNVPVSSTNFIAGLISNSELPFFDNVEVLASNNYEKKVTPNKGEVGILECKINKGILLSFGTYDWFSCNNYNSSEEIKKITFNSIDYLLEN